MTNCLPAALELVRALHSDSPQLVIIAGGLTAAASADEFIQAGCSTVCASVAEGRRMIRERIVERVRTRRSFWSYSRAPRTGVGQQRRS
jgi:hypothetical protein